MIFTDPQVGAVGLTLAGRPRQRGSTSGTSTSTRAATPAGRSSAAGRRARRGSSSTRTGGSSSAPRSPAPRSRRRCTRPRSPSSPRCRSTTSGTRCRRSRPGASSGCGCSRRTGCESSASGADQRARLLAPIDAPEMAAFVAALDPVNARADAAPGFVWRLQTEAGNATGVQASDDPLVIVEPLGLEVDRGPRGRSPTARPTERCCAAAASGSSGTPKPTPPSGGSRPGRFRRSPMPSTGCPPARPGPHRGRSRSASASPRCDQSSSDAGSCQWRHINGRLGVSGEAKTGEACVSSEIVGPLERAPEREDSRATLAARARSRVAGPADDPRRDRLGDLPALPDRRSSIATARASTTTSFSRRFS